MSSQEFDRWLRKTWTDCDRNKEAPTAVSRALKERLRTGVPTSDQAVINAVGAWTGYEYLYLTVPPKPLSWKERQGLHSGTYRLIDELTDLVSGRPLLQARLYAMKAALIKSNDQRPEDAIEANEKVLALLNPMSNEVESMRMTSLLAVGDALLRSGQKEQAEKEYNWAMTFDFADVEDPEARKYLRECYVNAAKGLIECRRTDAHALRENTFFLPQMNATLKPLLEEAIRRAEAEGPPVARERPEHGRAPSDPLAPVFPKKANGTEVPQ